MSENQNVDNIHEEETLFAKMKALVEKEAEELPHSSSRRGFLQSVIAAALPVAALTKTAKSMEACGAFENPGGDPCPGGCQTECEVFCQSSCQFNCEAACESDCQTSCQAPGAGCQTTCLASCQHASCLAGCEHVSLICFPETLYCGPNMGCQGADLISCGYGGCQIFGVMVR